MVFSYIHIKSSSSTGDQTSLKLTMTMKFIVPWISGGSRGNLSVICGSPPKLATATLSSTTISRTTLTSTQLSHAYSAIESSIESTSVVNTIDNTDVTLSSSTTYVSYDSHSLSVESTQDDPKMLCKYTVDHFFLKILQKSSQFFLATKIIFLYSGKI